MGRRVLKPTAEAHLRLENAKLSRRLESLRGAVREGARLRNAPINDLVTSLGAGIPQTNLTSFNPIIQNNIYAPLTIDWLTLAYFYKTHGIIQTAIEVPVLDALRGGVDITSPSGELDAEDIKDLQDFLMNISAFRSIRKGSVWARLFGGGSIILLTADQDPATPLQLKKGMGVKFYAATRWELGAGYRANTPEGVAMTPLEEYNARFSEFYNFYGKNVHRSRVLTMSGKDAPPPINWQLQGWGMSEVERMIEDFNLYIKTNNVLYEILQEAKLDVYRVDGFGQSLMAPGGVAKITNRIQAANQIKNFNRALVLDKNDEFEQKQLTFSGLAEVKKENRMAMACAARMPITKLFGVSASGFNSGEDDIENYNAMVESEVREDLRPVIRQVLLWACWHLFGFEPDIEFNFKPLRVMSSMDEETVKTSKQARTVALYDRGLYTPEEAMEELKREKLVTIDTAAEEGLVMDRPEDVPGRKDGGAGVEKKDGKKGEGKEEGDDE